MAKRLLVPVAQIDPADSFVTALGDLARGAGATVRLLHVAETPTSVVDVDGRVIAYADQETLRLDAEARDYLETIALRLDGVPVEVAVRFGDPARGILAEADDFGADLIALGVGPRRRVRLGRGVAGRIVRRADIPVAIFRAGRHESGRR
jgi:nucleotide-binding universal stress UspA family protein